jgi:hypothetical protein
MIAKIKIEPQMVMLEEKECFDGAPFQNNRGPLISRKEFEGFRGHLGAKGPPGRGGQCVRGPPKTFFSIYATGAVVGGWWWWWGACVRS